MKQFEIIGWLMMGLIPVGFTLKFFLEIEGLLLVVIITALALIIINLTYLHSLLKGKKGGQLLALYVHPIVMIPAIYFSVSGVQPGNGSRLNMAVWIIIVLAYCSLCILIGVKLGASGESKKT